MLKDITLGQYIPGNSVVHRLDPRTKILLMIAYSVHGAYNGACKSSCELYAESS